MREIRYADAGLDMRKLALCFWKRIWMAAVAAAVGAALGALVYMAVSVVPESEREYQAMSKIYLDFAPDETGEIYQAYNGYTWNDLMATDPILDGTMRHLPKDYSREEVTAATKAEILSDLRLLTVTVTSHDADRCNAILQATGQSLEDRGDEAKEFRRIEVIRTTQAKLLTADSRFWQAVLIGLVLALALVLLGMLLFYVLDDRIMAATDLRAVTDVPFVGYGSVDVDRKFAGMEERAGCGSADDGTEERAGHGGADGGTEERAEYDGVIGKAGCVGAGKRSGSVGVEAFQKEYEAGLAYLRETKGKIAVHSVVQGAELTQERWRELLGVDGVVLEVPYGKVHAVYLGYVLEQFALRECPVVGVAVSRADDRFLRRYYGKI